MRETIERRYVITRTSLCRDNATLHLRQSKLCALARNDKVTVEYDFDAATVRSTVDSCDHRFCGNAPSGDVRKSMDMRGDILSLSA